MEENTPRIFRLADPQYCKSYNGNTDQNPWPPVAQLKMVALSTDPTHPTPAQQLHDDRKKFCDASAVIRTESQTQCKILGWTGGHFKQILW